jgi:hypothetical protein
MAIVRTLYGDTAAPATLSGKHMDVTEVDLELPLSNRLVQLGAFNAWRPITVRIQDGSARTGGSHIDVACWAVSPTPQGQTLQVKAFDAAKWMERRSTRRSTSAAQPAGQHVVDLFANIVAHREERPGWGYTPVFDSGDSAWPYTIPQALNQIPFGTQWVGAAAVDSSHSADYRRAVFTVPAFSNPDAADPVSVKLRLVTAEYPGVIWSNTVEVSADGGSTWETAHTLPAQSTLHETWIDLSGDRAWVAADLDTLQVRLTVAADADYAGSWNTAAYDANGKQTVPAHITFDGPQWSIDYVGIQCDFAGDVVDQWPIRLAQIDLGGPVITLPDIELKTFRGWLDYLVEQTGYEWQISSDWNQLGVAGLNWQPRIGTDFSATVTIRGKQRQVASLEEGQLISTVHASGVDGLAVYSQVRATAQGLDDVVVTNATLAADIGVHEYVLDLGSNATATDQANAAAQKLTELGNPASPSQFDVPRRPGLWAQLAPGTTTPARFRRGAITGPWDGVIRLLGWKVDERTGVMTLDALSVQDGPSSTQPVGQGYRVQTTPAARKKMPETLRLESFKRAWQLARRQAR